DSEDGRPVQSHRAGSARLRAVRFAVTRAVQVYVLEPGEGDDAFHRGAEAHSFRGVCVRLWLTYGPADGDRTSGTGDGHHHAERQRLRRRTERRLEPHPGVLEGAKPGQPGRVAYPADAGDDVLAVHDRRQGHISDLAGRLQPGQLLYGATRRA